MQSNKSGVLNILTRLINLVKVYFIRKPAIWLNLASWKTCCCKSQCDQTTAPEKNISPPPSK